MAQLFPGLVHHGIKSFGSRDVLRFLGRKPPANGVGKFVGELNSSLNGFRNRDLRARLYSAKATKPQQKRRASTLTRKIRLLRAHGLIRKVSGTHRYVVTERGRRIITALLSARQADMEKLTALAA